MPEGEEEMDDNDDEDEMADFIVYEVGEPGLSRCGNLNVVLFSHLTTDFGL